jgi:hypothetical protein
MATKRRIIGFDRKIQLAWLDATADWAAQGISVPEIRSKLHELLAEEVAGGSYRGAREKTITVLLHIWVLVPDNLVPLRDDGLRLLGELPGQDRLPLHWGMCMASYPFFRDVAATTGRLLALQGTAVLAQITRRMAGVWGDRSTLNRAVQRVLRSLVLWGALHETSDRGIFAPPPKRPVKDSTRLSPWLLEASILNSGRRAHSLQSLLTSTALFPFALNANPQDVLANPRLELHRQDLDEHLVLLKGAM